MNNNSHYPYKTGKEAVDSAYNYMMLSMKKEGSVIISPHVLFTLPARVLSILILK